MVDLGEIQAVYYMVAATGVLVAAAYYVLNMRATQRNMKQTLETRQAQMFMNIYDKSSSKEFQSGWRKVMMTPWSTWEEFQKLYNEPEFNDAWNTLLSFYEGTGVLVKEGLLNVRMIALLMCGMTRLYFDKVKPIVYEGRRIMGFNRWFSETEYLYDELIKYLGEHPELDTRIEAIP